MSAYKTRVVGALNTLDYKMYIEESASGKVVSPFHDIPLFADASGKVLNMVVEIPRWTNAKMEVCFLFDCAVCHGSIDANRSLKMRLSIPSSKTPRRESSAMSATVSPTMDTSGTTERFPRPGRTPPLLIQRPRPWVITIPLMCVKSVKQWPILDRSNRSKFLERWPCLMREKLTVRDCLTL